MRLRADPHRSQITDHITTRLQGTLTQLAAMTKLAHGGEEVRWAGSELSTFPRPPLGHHSGQAEPEKLLRRDFTSEEQKIGKRCCATNDRHRTHANSAMRVSDGWV